MYEDKYIHMIELSLKKNLPITFVLSFDLIYISCLTAKWICDHQ